MKAPLEAIISVRSGSRWAGKGVYRVECRSVEASNVDDLFDELAEMVNSEIDTVMSQRTEAV